MNLQIKKVNGLKWKIEDRYCTIDGFSLYEDSKGYMSFKHDGIPYVPTGGKKALQRIIDDGGLTSYDNVVWINPI